MDPLRIATTIAVGRIPRTAQARTRARGGIREHVIRRR